MEWNAYYNLIHCNYNELDIITHNCYTCVIVIYIYIYTCVIEIENQSVHVQDIGIRISTAKWPVPSSCNKRGCLAKTGSK